MTTIVKNNKKIQQQNEDINGYTDVNDRKESGLCECPDKADPLDPLNSMYELLGEEYPQVEYLHSMQDMPQPWRDQLWHEQRMTQTMEAYHNTEMKLRVLKLLKTDKIVSRLIHLVSQKEEDLLQVTGNPNKKNTISNTSSDHHEMFQSDHGVPGRPVLFAGIFFYLPNFPEKARELIVEAKTPFGKIIQLCNMRQSNHVGGYIKVKIDKLMKEAMWISDETFEKHKYIYGRCNKMILDHDNKLLAYVVDMIPPPTE